MNNQPSSPPRRELLQAAALAAVTQLAGTETASATTTAPTPSATVTATPTPGKPGDFDFLTGEWKIKNRRLKNPATKEWDEYPGEATVWSILGGVCSIEELRIPARSFSGMGLRLLDVEKRVWSDHWVNAKSGVVGAPGVTGSFEKGAGIFISTDEENGKPVRYRGLWDGITKTSCRWSQSVSRDDGKTWGDIWLMQWTRV
ncbi:MAG: hypothetical protein EAZ30_09440 [Betaproteobacteria bacterium]|nr:MAG: hypothetical protein EAZ30_09440 [Betaproteobacteria bacterium]